MYPSKYFTALRKLGDINVKFEISIKIDILVLVTFVIQ